MSGGIDLSGSVGPYIPKTLIFLKQKKCNRNESLQIAKSVDCEIFFNSLKEGDITISK